MSEKSSVSNSTSYRPFVKWVGGKRGLLEQIIPLFPKRFENYHEPFVGGGAVFFALYSRGMLANKKIRLSDINRELINTYQVVRDTPEALITVLKDYKAQHSESFYYRIRELDRNEETFRKLSAVERAARFIYLNKTCYNGLYRVNKKGYFNTPMGKYKDPAIVDADGIMYAAEALQNAVIEHEPFDSVARYARRGDFIYFDPPYYPLTSTANFTSYDSNTFLEKEQKKLFSCFKTLDERGCFIAHSNSDTDFIKSLYEAYDIRIVRANRFINAKGAKRGKITEVLIRNYTV
jgi:DNA adenine methylase